MVCVWFVRLFGRQKFGFIENAAVYFLIPPEILEVLSILSNSEKYKFSRKIKILAT